MDAGVKLAALLSLTILDNSV